MDHHSEVDHFAALFTEEEWLRLLQQDFSLSALVSNVEPASQSLEEQGLQSTLPFDKEWLQAVANNTSTSFPSEFLSFSSLQHVEQDPLNILPLENDLPRESFAINAPTSFSDEFVAFPSKFPMDNETSFDLPENSAWITVSPSQLEDIESSSNHLSSYQIRHPEADVRNHSLYQNLTPSENLCRGNTSNFPSLSHMYLGNALTNEAIDLDLSNAAMDLDSPNEDMDLNEPQNLPLVTPDSGDGFQKGLQIIYRATMSHNSRQTDDIQRIGPIEMLVFGHHNNRRTGETIPL